MRGKKVAINTVFSLLEELTAVICGFILPRVILSTLGSQYNGLINSITQFLACAVLLRSGIGGATRAALYKPMAENNFDDINAIVKATDNFMKKIGLILAGVILVFASVFPFIFKNEFGWIFVFSLFLIIGASTFAESFFGVTYLIVLQADQRVWISSLLRIICYILNTVVSVLLIFGGFSIHIVKLGSALIYVAYPIVMGAYVKHHYKIKTNVIPNNRAISQRWDAFWQQVAVFVMDNTDVMVLTVLTNMLEVSVYSVYNLVVSGLKRAVQSFSSGLEAAFGNMIALKEEKVLKDNVSIIENIMYSVSTVVYTCAAILIVDFVSLYTQNVTDVNYIRPTFAYVIIVSQFFNGIRIPYQMVVQAAGHYKQTKAGAILEPILNISVSVVLVIKFGLVGVAIGTLVATVFRTIQYSWYMSKALVKRSVFITFKRIMVSILECVIILAIMHFINMPIASSYLRWVLNALVSMFVSVAIVLIINSIVFRKDMIATFKKIKNLKKGNERK